MGPFQFIPSSWRIFGVDGNGGGFADPNNVFDPHRDDKVIDPLVETPLDVGHHHHRIQRLIDAQSWFKDLREERTFARLRRGESVRGFGLDARRQITPVVFRHFAACAGETPSADSARVQPMYRARG